MLRRFAMATLAWMTLAGCVSNSYCLDEQPYQSAESVPPLVGTEDIALPQSATVLRIPPPPENPVPFGELVTDADGDKRGRCLDLPPPMPGLEKPPAPEEEEQS